MSYKGRSRPGKGSTKPANVKLRPAPAPEEQARPRKNGTGKNARLQEDSDDEDEEDEADKLAREQFAVAEEDQEEQQELGNEKRPLEGMTVCTSGQFDVPKEQLRDMCRALGATFDIILTTDTTFLISNTTDSDKYRACVVNGIPVLTSDFIVHLHSQWISAQPGIDVKELSESLRLPPLSELTICLTGYDGLGETSTHRDYITGVGGAAYRPKLTGEVTHLVLGPNIENKNDLFECGKVKAAKQINKMRAQSQEAKKPIWIVWGEWLEHSLCAMGRVREDHYNADLYQDRDSCQPPALEEAKDIISRRDEGSPAKAKNRKRKEDHAQIKAKRRMLKREADTAIGEPQMYSEGSTGRSAQGNGSKLDVNVSAPEILVEETMLDLIVDADGKEAPEPAVLRHKSRSLSAQPVPSTSTTPYNESLPALDRRSSMRKQQSSTDVELQGVQNLLGHERTEITQRRSLQPSSSIGSLNARTENLHISSAAPVSGGSILSKMGKARSSKFVTKAREDSMNMRSGMPSSSGLSNSVLLPSAPSTSRVTLDDDVNISSSDTEPSSLPLEGKTLYFVYPEKTPEELARIAKGIEANGGKVVASDGPDVDYVVCEALRDSVPDFDLDDPRVITGLWLQALLCVEDGLPESCHPLAQVFKKPVRCPLPLPNRQDFNITYSGFDSDIEIPALKELLAKLGIMHDANARRHVTTHLIVPDIYYQSKRINSAREWGLPIVSPQWLRDLTAPFAYTYSKSSTQHDSQMIHDVHDDIMTSGLPPREGQDRKSIDTLEGCHIHIATTQNRTSLQNAAERMGARIVYVLDTNMMSKTTHVVYDAIPGKAQPKEVTEALKQKIKVVHPDWLKECQIRKQKVPENAYKHTRNSKRTLEVVISSQPLSRGSSSNSAASASNSRLMPSDDELPPPLRQQIASRAPDEVHSSSPGKPVPDFSRANAASIDDSGFVPSSDKRKASDNSNHSSSSPKARNRQPMSTASAIVADAAPSTAITIDLMAEMEALMQADPPQQLNARLAYQQPGHQGRPVRKAGLKKEESDVQMHSSPRNSDAGPLAAKVLAHRHHGHGGYMETQFGNKFAELHTQEDQEEQTMVIRINDPVAEATKAKLLAGIRDAQMPVRTSTEAAEDEDATQPDTQATTRSSTRSTRSGNTRRR